MKMQIHHTRKGQSMILVALLMVVLIGMLAIVLDGGYAYMQRRTAQNAADAGALAGARELCETGNPEIAVARALEYAIQRNKALEADASASLDTGTVTVEARIPFTTFFGSILGRDQIIAAAIAEAGCFPPDTAMGILPIAWSCKLPVDVPVDPTPTPGPSNYSDCENILFNKQYVIMDSQKSGEDFFCQDPITKKPADWLDCDYDDDGINDLVAGGDRSWLDLNGGGGGSIELVDWINGGLQEDINIHTWFGGQSGVDTNVFQATNNRVGDTVLIPIFNKYCDQPGVPETSCLKLYDEGVDVTIPSGGESTLYYHVITFAAFTITCVDAPPYGPCEGHDAAVADGAIKANAKSIEGYFTNEFFSTVSGTPSDGVDAGVYNMYLIR